MSGFIDRLRSGAGKAAFEADKLRRIAAEQSSLKTLKEEVKKITQELGALTYDLHGSGRVQQPELVQICRRIDALQAQIASLEEKLEAIRAEEFVEEAAAATYTGRVCPRGHGPIAPENNFCVHCGAAAIVAAPPQSQGPVCDECGADLPREARFCTECGRPLVRKETADKNAQKTLLDGSDVWEASDWRHDEATLIEGPTAEEISAAQKAAGISSSQPTEAPAEMEAEETTGASIVEEAVEAVDSFPGEDVIEEEEATNDEQDDVDRTQLISADALKQHLEDVHRLREYEEGTGVEMTEMESDGTSCPSCDAPLLEDAIFCAECGFQVQEF